MKIGIFSPYLKTCGGGEKFVCTIAEILSANNKVDFVVTEEVDVKLLEARLNVNLAKVNIRHVKIPKLMAKIPYLDYVSKLYAISKATRDYDLFINQEHFSFIPSLAKRAVLICQVPMLRTRRLLRLPRKILGMVFDAKLETYDKIVTYSFFNKKWLEKKYEKKDIVVLYPPVDTKEFQPSTKENIILSVGRFFVGGHCKKQLEMIRFFKHLYTTEANAKFWEYHLIGGVSDKESDRGYLKRCQKEGQGFPVYFHINCPFNTVKEHYGRAKVFWHATGFGEDENKYPDRVEHFGIVTLEAMSAGCVPVVINKGGQAEIVHHMVNGFLWNSAEELMKYTAVLINDYWLWKSMSQAAIERAREFDIQQFRERVKDIFLG